MKKAHIVSNASFFFFMPCKDEEWARSTYMPIHQLGADVGLRVLVLDGVEAFVLVAAQCRLDVLVAGREDVVDVVCEKDSVLHGVHCASTTAWEEFVGGYCKESKRRALY